ncbi:MAG: DUF4349 domain-containing protein [Pseudomonadota bacterium]
MREVDGVAGPPNTSPTPKINNADADNRGEAIIAGQLLAYQYHASLRLPGDQVAAIAKTHEARCVAAGPKTCQVISSSTTNNGPNHVYANLDIRAAKSWMTPFREGLAQEADAAKGNLAAMSATAEDLTRSITDTAARLEAQKTLRARLIKLLERDTDKIGDLLQIERELARVQGEIESAQSYLRALNARVAMDRMTLNYEAIPKAISTGTTSPLVDAFRDFLGVLSSSLAMVIIFIAGAVPWIVVGIPVLWGLFKLVTRWRHKR